MGVGKATYTVTSNMHTQNKWIKPCESSAFSFTYPHYLCEDGIEKPVPRDHRLATRGLPSLVLPNGDPRDGLFCDPQTHDGFK